MKNNGSTFLDALSFFAKRFFGITFALYTLVSYGMMLLNLVTVKDAAPAWSGVALLFTHILLFSALTAFFFALVGVLERYLRLNSVVGHLLKFVTCYGAFYLCFFALQKNGSAPINIVVMSAIFALIYAVVAAIAGVRSAIIGRRRNIEAEYRSVYGSVSTEGEED